MPRTSARSFEHVLRERISLDDNEWDFAVRNLPSAESTNRAALIKMVHLSTIESRHRLTLRYVPVDMNRAIKDSPLSQYLVISFADFRSLRGVASSSTEAASNSLTQPTTPRECSDYAVKLLQSGIRIQGVHYNFYGHSNSQLKSRTCYLYAASKEHVTTKVESLGDFSKMKTVAKKAKRIGLLFSVARAVMTVDPKRVEDIPDIETGDYVFTDGCGLIAPKMAQDLSRRIRVAFRNVRYTPAVFQIRYQGYKGVVTLDPTMSRPGPWLRMRKSMKKFNGGDDLSFSVVEYSKPYTFGYLNDEVIVLLDALGIDRQVLIRKQQDHFNLLHDAIKDPRAAFRLLCHLNMPDIAEKVILDSLDVVRPTIIRLINNEHDKMLNKRGEQKCRILIPRSRLLFGVCDAWGVLKEGQCAVKVTMDGDGQPYALKGMKVLVTRNPCLHPGDLQKLDVVERPELAHLVDCIVFPTKGRRPAADMMSGGDLDGDTFFVSWDPDIIPSTISQAAQYPGVREPIRFTNITDDDRLKYFAKYTNASLGRVKNLYLKWARAKGAMSPECQELNRLFSQCVDGNRIKESQLVKFENPPTASPDMPPFVLDELHEAAKGIIVARRGLDAAAGMDGYTLDGMELLLSRDNIAISEMELIKMTLQWCRKTKCSFSHLLHAMDFNALTAEEKSWVLAQVPASIDTPSLVMNALCTSNLFEEGELSHFHLDYPGVHWKRVYTSDQDRLATFLDAASRNLELFHKTLIVFHPSDRLTLAMYVPQQITPADDFLVDTKVKMFAFPHSQGRERQSRLSLPTKKGYRLFCDENTLQLFEGKRGNTWVYIGRGASNSSSYQNLPRKQDRRKARQETLENEINFDFRVSVALDKFGRGLQNHMGRLQRQGISAAEIYIISNRDTRSLKNLDLWENYIDNEEKLPLFERTPKEYDLPNLRDVDWGAQDRLVVEVVKRENFLALQDVIDAETLRRLFSWLLESEQKGLINRCYKHLAVSIQRGATMAPSDSLRVMLEFLERMPTLSVTIVQLGQWKALPEELGDMLQNRSALLLRYVILSESEYGELVVAPFHHILDNMDWLSLTDFADLVEVISLTVHDSDIAMDLLLEGLERESPRLLTGRPAIIQHFVHNMAGIAVEHLGQVHEEMKTREGLLSIQLDEHQSPDHWGTKIVVPFRIDATDGTPATNTHVRLVTASPPASSLLEKTYTMDGLVVESRPGIAKIICFHPLPSYYQECSWQLQHCGLFATTKTMLDAMGEIAMLEGDCCGVIDQIVGVWSPNHEAVLERRITKADSIPLSIDLSLNESQNSAVEAAEANALTCLWGPPGTGKTQTIVSIIRRLQLDPEARILVSAPTHNAVDNVMRRYLKRIGEEGVSQSPLLMPLRVSTEVRKVAEDLRKYTCDALAGEEVYSSHNAMRQAKKRVNSSRIVFTTCIGAGLGLLREQMFDIVIVDEASQQTEPASLVPLAKGCTKVILVGDHVQLRPTVQNIALSLNFDVSLFERLYTREGKTEGIAKVMLNTQYRMHPSICQFSSREFYNGKLLSGVKDEDRVLPESSFPWPALLSPLTSSQGNGGKGQMSRMLFIECPEREDLGNKSKVNHGQADLCVSICKLLLTTKPTSEGEENPKESPPTKSQVDNSSQLRPSIVVLTPYSRQAQLLKRLLAGVSTGVEVSSIDGFQGREADIVIFVTVRCNESAEIGFLKDVRRMNVALTRAKLGLVVVGNRATLTGGRDEEESTGMWRRLLESLVRVGMDGEDNGI